MPRIRSTSISHLLLLLPVLAFAACSGEPISPDRSMAEEELLRLLAEQPETLTDREVVAAKELLATERGERLYEEIVAATAPDIVESPAGDGVVARVVAAEGDSETTSGMSPQQESVGSARALDTEADAPVEYTVEKIPFHFEPQPSHTDPVLSGKDDAKSSFDIGFEFEFFGNRYDRLYASTNGLTGFNPNTSPHFKPKTIPSTDGSSTNNIIPVLWTDMNPSSRGAVRYETRGSAPNRRLVVHYNNICYFLCSSNVDLQLVLHEGTNIIELHTRTAGAEKITQGIENPSGTVAYYMPGRSRGWFGLTEDGVRFAPVAPNEAPSVRVGEEAYSGTEGNPVALDMGADDPDGDTLTYAWDLGDGTTGSGSTPPTSHTYVDDGSYTITLLVDDGTESTSDAVTAEIANAAPTVDVGADRVIRSGESLDLSGVFNDAGAADAPWDWTLDWGDGSTDDGSTDDPSAPITGMRVYTAIGTYDVALAVTDKDDATGSDEMTVTVERRPVAVDIKPGGDPNSVNPGSQGVIPVAILSGSSDDDDAVLDATKVDWSTVRFGPDEAMEAHGRGHIEDVDDDGDLDMVLHFRTQDAGIVCGDTEATLVAQTDDGIYITGTDAVRTVGCEG